MADKEMTTADWIEVGKAFAQVARAITTSRAVPMKDERRLPLPLYQGPITLKYMREEQPHE